MKRNNIIKVFSFLLFLCTFFAFSPRLTYAAGDASFNLSTSSTSVNVDGTFVLTLTASSPSVSMNAASGTINFPKDLVNAVSISRGSSRINFWVEEPTINNSNGKITFAGVMFSDGFVGRGANIFSVTFKAKSIGKANLTLSNPQILANDGNGTNIFGSTNSASITINPVPTPTATPAKSIDIEIPGYTNQKRLVIDARNFINIKEISYALNQSQTFAVDEITDTQSNPFNLDFSNEGEWFFHYKIKDGTWSEIVTKKIIVDFTSPQLLIEQLPREDTAERYVTFQISASDDLSGIQKYVVFLNDKEIATMEDPNLPKSWIYGPLKKADNKFRFLVYDKSGNISEETIEVPLNPVVTQPLYDKALTIFCGKNEDSADDYALAIKCTQSAVLQWTCIVLLNLVLLTILVILFFTKRKHKHEHEHQHESYLVNDTGELP